MTTHIPDHIADSTDYPCDQMGWASYRVLAAYEESTDEQIVERVKQRFSHALPHFPELAGKTVTVGRMKPDSEYAMEPGYGRADPYNHIVFVPPDEDYPMQAVFHELAHLAIQVLDERGADVPTTSEEFCSIFAVARMPPQMVDRPIIGYLGEPAVPQSEWPDICRRALEYRENHHNYIQQCKEWLEI